MFRQCEQGAMEVLYGMAAFAPVPIRCGRKLAIVGVLVAVHTICEFHFVDRVFARWNVTLRAFHPDVPALERVFRSDMFLYPE